MHIGDRLDAPGDLIPVLPPEVPHYGVVDGRVEPGQQALRLAPPVYEDKGTGQEARNSYRGTSGSHQNLHPGSPGTLPPLQSQEKYPMPTKRKSTIKKQPRALRGRLSAVLVGQGSPQCGQDLALSLTSLPHSLHLLGTVCQTSGWCFAKGYWTYRQLVKVISPAADEDILLLNVRVADTGKIARFLRQVLGRSSAPEQDLTSPPES